MSPNGKIYLPMTYMEIAVVSFLGWKGWEPILLPVTLSMTTTCAFLVKMNRTPSAELLGFFGCWCFGLFMMLLICFRTFMATLITGELEPGTQSVWNTADSEPISNIATCSDDNEMVDLIRHFDKHVLTVNQQ